MDNLPNRPNLPNPVLAGVSACCQKAFCGSSNGMPFGYAGLAFFRGNRGRWATPYKSNGRPSSADQTSAQFLTRSRMATGNTQNYARSLAVGVRCRLSVRAACCLLPAACYLLPALHALHAHHALHALHALHKETLMGPCKHTYTHGPADSRWSTKFQPPIPPPHF